MQQHYIVATSFLIKTAISYGIVLSPPNDGFKVSPPLFSSKFHTYDNYYKAPYTVSSTSLVKKTSFRGVARVPQV